MKTTHAASIRGVSVLVLTLLLGAGCQYRVDYYTPSAVAVSPVGTEASITVQEGAADRTITGELIEAREDGLLILSSETSELMLLPYGRVVEMDFEDAPGVNTCIDCSSAFRPILPLIEDEERQRALAQFSRYPFGLDDAQLQRLLEALGQSELVVIGS